MHTRICFWIVLLGLTLGGTLVLAQEGAPAPAPAPAPSPGATTSPSPGGFGGRENPPGQQPGRQQPGFEQPGQRQDQMRQLEQRPVFLSGKVMMEDGTPPPESRPGPTLAEEDTLASIRTFPCWPSWKLKRPLLSV